MPEGTGTLVASVVITGFAIVAVALRFYVRMRLKVGVAWDDWSIFIGLVLTLITAGVLLWGVSLDPDAESLIQEAIDNHTLESFPASLHVTYLKLNFALPLLYFQIVTAIEVSILLMYRRIFGVNRAFRLQSLLLGITILAFWVTATTGTFVNCRPGCYSWVTLSLSEECLNFNVFWMATGIAEIVIDTVLLAMPVRMVLGLQLSRKSKASVVFIFLLGGFMVITGILRIVYGYVPGSRKPSYSGAGLWSAIHIGMAIVCACLPTLRPLATRFSSLKLAFSSLRQRYYSLRGPGASNSDDMRPLSTKHNVSSDSMALKMVRGSGTISPNAKNNNGSDHGSAFSGVGRGLSLA